MKRIRYQKPAPDAERCEVTVFPRDASWGGFKAAGGNHQCIRRGVVLVNGKRYCRQHAKEVTARN